MRILLIAGRASSDSMEAHVLKTLAIMGHQTLHFNIRSPFPMPAKLDRPVKALMKVVFREPERIAERKLLKEIDDFKPDFILVLLGNSLSPKTVHKIRSRLDIPIVCWCQDALVNMQRQYLIGAEYDAIFLKDHYLVDIFRNMVGHENIHYLPEACNPSVHKPVEVSEIDRLKYECEITTFATLYYYRQSILLHLDDHKLKLWGNVPDWLVNRLKDFHTGQTVSGNEKCKAIAGSKIVLNTLHYAEIDGLNCRTFEVAACGGFQLMTHSTAVAEHFKIGEEIETFHSIGDLKEKVVYYLGNPEKRSTIAQAGQRRAYSEHTYEHRLTQLIQTIARLS